MQCLSFQQQYFNFYYLWYFSSQHCFYKRKKRSALVSIHTLTKCSVLDELFFF